MPEDFSGCESFHNLRKFTACEISQVANFRRLRKFATWYCSSSPPATLCILQLFV